MTRLHVQFLILAAAVVVCGCEREPDDPLDRFVFQFEEKTETLFDHLANADEVLESDRTIYMDGRLSTTTSEYYRYMHIGPAAVDVIEHFDSLSVAFYLAIVQSDEIDPEWVAELKSAVNAAQVELAERVDTFRHDMPRRPRMPGQPDDVTAALSFPCSPGGALSLSEGCRIGRYGYDDSDRLYFELPDGRLWIENLLDIDIDMWLAAVRDTQIDETLNSDGK